KRAALGDGYRYNTRLKYSEDGRFLTELILRKMSYGLVVGPSVYYRKRFSNDSALNKSIGDISYYTDTIRLFSQYLINSSRKNLGYVPKYVQHLVMYDLQWRLTQQSQEVLSKLEETSYKKTIYQL